MKFIIPQNYDFSSKLFGFIDYSTVIFNIIWCLFVYCIINIFISTLFLKLFIFLILAFPIFLLSIIGFNHENILYVFLYIAKYFMKQKIYLYK